MDQADRVTEMAKRLAFKSIETLPWELDNDYEPPKKRMPVGIVLRKRDGCLTLVGNDIGGPNTRGCTCCSELWEDAVFALERYTEWAWLI
jgi:hypothetical protein